MGTYTIDTLGPCKIASPLPFLGHHIDFPFVPDERRVRIDNEESAETVVTFEAAGPRDHIYFDPSKLRVGIVTCGGLCPGINNVIRTIVMQLSHSYHVNHIIGFRYGFQGFIPEYGHETLTLDPDTVENIHATGGSLLASSRGQQDIGEIVDCLERQDLSMLFCIGGDGTLRGTQLIAEEVQRRELKIAVIGIPKTIDNDIMYCEKTFGFETAFSTAVDAIRAAHVEALGAPNGISLVKLMGRDSGFIAANTVLACPEVNFVLIPEVPFNLEGDKGLLMAIEHRLQSKVSEGDYPHAVIVVAEGAGQEFFKDLDERDASGNIKYGDIGNYLNDRIKTHFEGRLPVTTKYIEPSYLIRSVPAIAHDAIFCHSLADNAVHAGMAGKTNMMVGYAHGRFTHVPLNLVSKHRKRVDPRGDLWRQVLLSTGQHLVMD